MHFIASWLKPNFYKGFIRILNFGYMVAMVLNKYRDRFQKLIDGPANLCIKLHISPNQLSFIAFLVSIVGATTFAFPHIFLFNYTQISPKWYFWWGWVPLLLFGLGSYLDVLDGTVARKTEQVSHYGGFLDSTLDRLSDGAIILGLVMGKMLWPWEEDSLKINALLGFMTLMFVMLISYIRSRAENEGVEMRGIGFMERAERVLFILIAYVVTWVVYCIQTQYFDGFTLLWIFTSFFLIFIILCFHTFMVRIIHTYRSLK